MTDATAARAALQTAAPSSQPAGEDGFVPVQGMQREQVSATTTVIAAYVIIWAIMTFFVFLTVRKLAALRAAAERLEAALRKG